MAFDRDIRRTVLACVGGEASPTAERLSHDQALAIAAIGDSLSTGFHLSSPLAMIWRARTNIRRSWFLDTSASIESVCERLERTTPIVPYHFATVAAKVQSTPVRTFAEHLIGARHFSEQVANVNRLVRFPDVVLIWIGHNDLDWVTAPYVDSRSCTNMLFERLTRSFIHSFSEQLTRLLDGAARADHPVAIIVFALVNFRQFFMAREKAEDSWRQSPHQYRRHIDGYAYFQSMRPEHREGMIQLAKMFNEALANLVETLGRIPSWPPHVMLRYSTALHDTDISSEGTLSHMDAWHPSPFGHSLLAASAYKSITEIVASLNETRKRAGV